MAVHCTRCGEELMGAVNRCWKCGQQFLARPTQDGLPPVRVEPSLVAAQGPLEARVLEDDAAMPPADGPNSPAAMATTPARPTPAPAAYPFAGPPINALATPAPMPSLVRPVPKTQNYAALGGAYSAVVLGLLGVVLAWFRYEAAIIGFIGLLAGIWGIYSPRRGLALAGMLLCCLAIGLGTFTGTRQLYIYLNRNAPIVLEEESEEELP